VTKNNFLKIGIIKKPHGIKGELKVLPLTDNSGRYKKLKKVFICTEQAFNQNDYSTITEHTIKSLHFSPTEVVMLLDNITSRNDAQKLARYLILIERKDGEKLGEWEYYSQDLVGCEVYFKEQKVGTVFNLLNTGANDNLEIETTDNKEIVYPFLREFINSVDIEAKRIVINEYEGFFD